MIRWFKIILRCKNQYIFILSGSTLVFHFDCTIILIKMSSNKSPPCIFMKNSHPFSFQRCFLEKLNIYNEFVRNFIQYSNRFIFLVVYYYYRCTNRCRDTGVAFKGYYFYPVKPERSQTKFLVDLGIFKFPERSMGNKRITIYWKKIKSFFCMYTEKKCRLH